MSMAKYKKQNKKKTKELLSTISFIMQTKDFDESPLHSQQTCGLDVFLQIEFSIFLPATEILQHLLTSIILVTI